MSALDLEAPAYSRVKQRPRLGGLQIRRQVLPPASASYLNGQSSACSSTKKSNGLIVPPCRRPDRPSTANSRVFSGKYQPRQEIAERVLLPVDEVVLGLDVQRVGEDRRAAVRRRAQADDLRPEACGPVVGVFRAVGKRDVKGHCSSRGWSGGGSRLYISSRTAPRWGRANVHDAGNARLVPSCPLDLPALRSALGNVKGANLSSRVDCLSLVPKWNGNARSALGLGEPRGLSLFQGKIFSPNPLNLPSGPVLSLRLRNLESPVLLPRIDDVPPYRVRNKIGDL